MDSDRKEQLYMSSWRKHWFQRFKNGLAAIGKNPLKALIPTMVTVIYVLLYLYLNKKMHLYTSGFFTRLECGLLILILYMTIIPVLYFLIAFMGTSASALRVDPQMERISVKNGIGETPVLLSKKKQSDGKTATYEFTGDGIPLSFYEDHLPEIESALNVNVTRLEQGRRKNSVYITGIDFAYPLPSFIEWDESFMQTKDFVLAVGANLTGLETVDLNKVPHMLIGGSTGSGKSVCLKNIIYQCSRKGAKVYIADFKGGVDYAGKWSDYVEVITDIDKLIVTLKETLIELQIRKSKLLRAGAVNISEYNSRSSDTLQRIIIACDEVAELLDKTGLLKEDKEKVIEVEGMLSTIARQGRAFGINLILATQRPDANILSGQIRNNIDYRICGRADDVLSKIVLDNTDASEKIPKFEQGLFLSNEGTLIRGFYFDEASLR